MFACLKILELLAKSKCWLGQIKGEWNDLVHLSEEVHCPWGKKGRVMRRLFDYTAGQERELVDGIRVSQQDAWVLAIPDRRKASFTVAAESICRDRAEALLEEFSQKVVEFQED